MLKEDQLRLKGLLTEAIRVLCKNGLQFVNEFSVEGLLGITIDNSDVMLISINEIVRSDLTVAFQQFNNAMQSYLPKNPADWKGSEHIAAAAGLPAGYAAGAHDGMPPLMPLSLQDQLLLMRGAGMKRPAMSPSRSRANSSPGAAPPGHGMAQPPTPQSHQNLNHEGDSYQHLSGAGSQGEPMHPLPPPPLTPTHQNPPLTPGSRQSQVFHSPPPMEHEPPAKRMHHDNDSDRPTHLQTRHDNHHSTDIPPELSRHVEEITMPRHGDQTPPELTQEEMIIQNHNNNNIKLEIIPSQVIRSVTLCQKY